ncbi:hypothetical protein FRC10_009913 [Ceratobasidium sp. 414]|nr:hypothetical protein FRC10_009913 [Ceratobasidium sp. 414]
MSEGVIDLTISDDEGPRRITRSSASALEQPAPALRRSTRSRSLGFALGNARAAEPPLSKEPRRKSKSEKVELNEERPQSNRSSNGTSSLLSRIGDLLRENETENKAKGKSELALLQAKRHANDINSAYSRVITHYHYQPQTSSSDTRRPRSRTRSPKPDAEIPLSELPVDQLFFIDTGSRAQGNESEGEISTPLGTGASTPNEAYGTSAKVLKRKQSKERKKERKIEARAQGDRLGNGSDQNTEVEFVGGEALTMGDTVVATSTARATVEVTPSTTAITDSTRVDVVKQAADGTTSATTLTLPSHVTLWAKGDPDVSLADVATGGLQPEEGVEYLDYDEDQATGAARYFMPEAGVVAKKLCRTCGEEGHIARFCKKLIVMSFRRVLNHEVNMDVIVAAPLPTSTSASRFLKSVPSSKTFRLGKVARGILLGIYGAIIAVAQDTGEMYVLTVCGFISVKLTLSQDCQEPRPYSAPKDPCAFSSHNASRGPFGDTADALAPNQEIPRPAWMGDDPQLQDVGRRGKEANMKRNRAAEASRAARERDEDDWFSRAAEMTCRLNPKIRPKPVPDQMGVTIYASGTATEGGIATRNETMTDTNGVGTTRTIGEATDAGSVTAIHAEDPNLGTMTGDIGGPGETSGGVTVTREGLNIAVRMHDTATVYFENAKKLRFLLGWPLISEALPTSSSGPPPPRVMDTEKAHTPGKASTIYVDVDSYDGNEREAPTEHTKRVLNARQVQLFSIGGTIGTSIFVAIGAALVHGGPLSLLLGYAFWCSVIFCVNEGQAEMVCLLPIESSFNRFAARWVDRAFGAATSWNYWVCMAAFVVISLSLLNFEVTAFTAVIGFWTDGVHPVVFPIAMLTAYALLHLWSAKFFGETEFWISLMKVILIAGLLIMTFFLMVGANPHRDAFGFRYWRDPGPMAEYTSTGDLGRLQGFFACVLSAGFAVAGPDMLSIIAGEAKAPRRIMPKAFRTVFVRLILFFVLGSLAVGILVPYNDPILNAAIAEGKPGGNAFLFNGSRTLHGIALDGFAPRLLRQTNRNGVPWITVLITLLAGCLSFLQVDASTSKVLDWFINVATSAQLVTWIAMSITWIRWNAAMQAQGVSREILPYRSRIQPYGAYYALTMSIIVTFFNGYYVFLKGGWATADFIFAYGSIFIFLGIYIGVKVLGRSPFVSAHEADLFSGKKEVDEYEARLVEKPPATRWQRISRWMF